MKIRIKNTYLIGVSMLVCLSTGYIIFQKLWIQLNQSPVSNIFLILAFLVSFLHTINFFLTYRDGKEEEKSEITISKQTGSALLAIVSLLVFIIGFSLWLKKHETKNVEAQTKKITVKNSATLPDNVEDDFLEFADCVQNYANSFDRANNSARYSIDDILGVEKCY